MKFKEYPEVNALSGTELLICADASSGETKKVPAQKLKDYITGKLFIVQNITYQIGTLAKGQYWVRESADAQKDFPPIEGWTREISIARINGTGSASVIATPHGFSVYAYAQNDCKDLTITVRCQWTDDRVVVYQPDKTISAPIDS